MTQALPRHSDIVHDGQTERDDALVAVAQTDRAAFALLYERHFTAVYRYLRTRTSSTDDTADLTQQVFLRAFEALPRYRPSRAPFAAWLIRIARNAATDAHRRRTSPGQLPVGGAEPSVSPPEFGIAEDERLDRLRELIAHLPEEKRELLALRFAAGLSSREIAAVVGRGESAVKKQLSRTLTQLKEQF